MSSGKSMTRSGYALVLAGLLIGIVNLFHQAGDFAEIAIGGRWDLVHGLVGLGLLLALAGIPALSIRLAGEMGLAGSLGFFLVMIGTGLTAGAYLFHEGLLLPTERIFGETDALFNPGGRIAEGSLFNPVMLGTFLATSLGYLIFGYQAFRSKDLPRWAGALLMAGGPLFAGIAPTVGGVLLGAGLAWIGTAMRSEYQPNGEAGEAGM